MPFTRQEETNARIPRRSFVFTLLDYIECAYAKEARDGFACIDAALVFLM